MFKSLRIVCLGLLAVLSLNVANAMAHEEASYDTKPGGCDTVGACYSPSLRAQFRVETFNLPAFGQFTGVRLVSEPAFDSPLRQLGLQAGDVITRLDGVRVDNLAELENHYNSTQVRYIKTGTQNVRIGSMFITVTQPIVNPIIGGGNAP